MAKKQTAAADTAKADGGDGDEPVNPYEKFISFDGDQTVISWRGALFRFPTSRALWPTRAFQAFQKQRHADGVEILFGPKQWDEFNRVAPRISDFWEFLPIFAQASGFVRLDTENVKK